jgi:hypothetical protein
MPVFILFSLYLSYLAETGVPMHSALISPLVSNLGMGGAVISIVGIFFKKFNEIVWYDLFLSSALLTWFSSWRPFFNEQAPMFFYFPIYFALIAAFVSFILLGDKQRTDRQTSEVIKAFVEKSGMHPWILMLLILGSLQLQHHFMLFPVLMTLLLVRFTLSGYLQSR